MKVITLNPRSLQLDVVDENELRDSALVIRPPNDYMSESILQDIVRDHNYHLVYLRDRRVGRKARYCLAPTDPWEVACAALVWQGIVQGLSWDLVKVSLSAAWKVLRHAPPETLRNPRNSHISETELGVRIERFGRDGRAQYRLFAGLRRISRTISGVEREAVLKELRKSNRIDRRARASSSRGHRRSRAT